MAILFRFAPRTGAAIDPRRDFLAALGEVTIGRAPRSDVRLAHETVLFEHAVLAETASGLVLRAGQGAHIGGSTVLAVPGDFALIGPYRLTRVAAEPGGPVVIVVTPEGGATQAGDAAAWYQRAFDVNLPNVRLMSFALCCVIAALFFILPLALAPRGTVGAPVSAVATPLGSFWNVGAISHAHRFFGGNCAACHQSAFTHVTAASCLQCHKDIGQHADPVLAPAADLRNQRCETCHREHKGAVLATRDEQADCVTCHGDIHTTAPSSRLRPVGDFARLHPDFAPSLVVDAAARRVAPVLPGAIDPPDHSGLRYTHAKHLALAKLSKPGYAACAQCHVPDASGTSFKPVTYDAACASCHAMPFEPRHPEWHLPHGHAEEIQSRIAGYYARAVLAGEDFAPPQNGLFARPGAPAPAAPLQGAELVAALTNAAMASSIARSDCGECHVVAKTDSGKPLAAWRVAPVYVPDRFMPRANFSHASHSTTPCATCHQARASNGGPLTLLPGISTCRQCHAGEQASGARIASTCVSCHGFHNGTLPLMTPVSIPPAGLPTETTQAKETQ